MIHASLVNENRGKCKFEKMLEIGSSCQAVSYYDYKMRIICSSQPVLFSTLRTTGLWVHVAK